MRKVLVVTAGLLAVALISNVIVTPTQAYIESYYWITPLYRGYDDFYGRYVVAYKTGSMAQLMIGVYNDWWYPNITITAVKVWFDWNENYTSTEVPYVLHYYEYHYFMINFTVPSTDVAWNLIPHQYRIYVEFTYDTSKSYWSYYPYEYFAVYSTDQADARETYMELGTKLSYVPYFYSYEARMLLSKAQTEYNIGYQHYTRGEFATAKDHWETGLSLFDSAFEKESNYTKTMDELNQLGMETEIDATKTEAEAAMTEAEASMKQADAAMIEANATKTEAEAAMIEANALLNQSYAWLMFGIGSIIVGIGVLVYAIKKPKVLQ